LLQNLPFAKQFNRKSLALPLFMLGINEIPASEVHPKMGRSANKDQAIRKHYALLLEKAPMRVMQAILQK
jgi:hypothetical protein